VPPGSRCPGSCPQPGLGALTSCPGGELFQRIAAAPSQRFGEAQAKFFWAQILGGVAYLHSQNMAHRDLKLENALLMDAGPRPRVAICDFGYTKSTQLHSAFHTANVGTPSYIAPELLLLGLDQAYDGKAVDVWAAGVVLYVMLVGGYPFGECGTNPQPLIRRITTATYTLPVPLSPAVTDLLARIFVVNPAARITVPQILTHPWLTSEPAAAPEFVWAPPPPASLQQVEVLNAILRQAAAPPAGREASVSDLTAMTDAGATYSEEEHLRDSYLSP